MLNTNNSSVYSHSFSSVFIDSNAEIVEKQTTGKVFTFDNFAKDWNSIYIRTDQLEEGIVANGSRCLIEPTLVTTTEGNRMSLILASKENPVFIPYSFYEKGEGYVLAYKIAPVVAVEYLFYLCKYGLWRRIIGLSADEDLVQMIGQVDSTIYGGELYETVYSPEMAYGHGNIELPSLEAQHQMVEAAKRQEADFSKHSVSVFDTKEIVTRYLNACNTSRLLDNASIGLLVEAYRASAGDEANPDVIGILSKYDFHKDILSREEIAFLGRNLNELFQLAIFANGITFNPSNGFVQPQEVTDFICKIASFPEDVIVYNPFAGADSYAIALPNNIVGEELNPDAWALGQIRLFANSADKRTEIALADSFESMKSNGTFKAIISSPAYLDKEGHKIADIVRMLYDKLEDGGKLVCIVSAGFLFNKDNKSRSVREALIKDKAISSVVMLPSNIFTGSSISQAVIVLTKGRPNEEILFADASGYTRYAKSVYRATTFDWEQFVKDLEEEVADFEEQGRVIDDTIVGAYFSYSELVDNNLTPNLYLTPKPQNGIALSELATEVQELRGKDIDLEYFITGSSIPAAMHRLPYTPTKVAEGKVSTSKRHVAVPRNAVILSIVNGNIRTVYTDDFTEKISFPAGFVKVLKPVEGISAKYLAAVLSTKIVADQIKAQTVGVTIPRLNNLDLGQIIVPLHSTVEEREQLISDVLSSEMSELESELQETLESQKREVSSTRHAMIQTLSSLSSKWERFKRFASANDGTIHLSDIIGRINPATVEEFMHGIEYAIDTLRRQVESFRLEKKDWGEPEDINPYEFIETYKATHPSTDFAMQNLGNDNKADVPYFTGDNDEEHTVHTDVLFTFKAPRALVERIFDNIVSNAKAHGFTSDIENPTIQFDWQTNGGKMEITIKNNGVPLKDGVSGADVLMSDFSTALKQKASDGSQHFGIGGSEIKSLMEGIGAVEVISQPDAEFPVIYKLTFNDVSFQEVKLFDD